MKIVLWHSVRLTHKLIYGGVVVVVHFGAGPLLWGLDNINIHIFGTSCTLHPEINPKSIDHSKFFWLENGKLFNFWFLFGFMGKVNSKCDDWLVDYEN